MLSAHFLYPQSSSVSSSEIDLTGIDVQVLDLTGFGSNGPVTESESEVEVPDAVLDLTRDSDEGEIELDSNPDVEVVYDSGVPDDFSFVLD